jgi:hypothetical protein
MRPLYISIAFSSNYGNVYSIAMRGARTMYWIVRFTAGIFLALFITSASFAQGCSNMADCPPDMTCQPSLFGGQCQWLRCNADSECPRPLRPVCFNGICQAGCRNNTFCQHGQICVGAGPAPGFCSPTSSPSGSGGISQSGEGGACGPRRFGAGIIKSVGCKRGLQCIHGFCQQLR